MESGGQPTSVSPQAVAFRRVAWVCLATALAHTVAVLLGVFAIRDGNLGDLSPLRLMQFIPQHIILWRSVWLASAVASLSFAVFAVAYCQLVDRRYRAATAVALIFVTVALTNDLNGQFSMMVLFSDLAYQMRGHGSFLQHETAQLAWSTMNQALTQCVLIANTLYGFAGFIISLSAMATRSFPKWIALVGLPIWFVMLSVSVLSFLGALKSALVLLLAVTVAFVLWTMVMGYVLRHSGPAAEPHA
ncbi:MAG TPA: hypothetical protein V6D08_04790 [Candidatus Obscuribacterales bacterium]